MDYQTASNVLCYECDSRYDPNCADPFDFSYSASLDPQPAGQQATNPRLPPKNNETSTTMALDNEQTGTLLPTINDQISIAGPNETSSIIIPQHRQPKKLPAATVCHGCCVKITSKSISGSK